MSHDLRADLDELLPKRRQRPVFDLLRQCQGAQEVAEIIGERMELEPDLVVAETVASAFLDPLLGCAPALIELRHALRRTGQVGHDETDP